MAAQVSIANGCLLVAYSLVGWLDTQFALGPIFLVLSGLTALCALAFVWLWPTAYAPE
jgi:hypothetical protein